jgi:hypothetical protein
MSPVAYQLPKKSRAVAPKAKSDRNPPPEKNEAMSASEIETGG